MISRTSLVTNPIQILKNIMLNVFADNSQDWGLLRIEADFPTLGSNWPQSQTL